MIYESYEQRQKAKKELFANKRAELRLKLMSDALFMEKPSIYQTEFDGYADGGTVHGNSGNSEVDDFLSDAVDLYVEFDWHNNDGGGGDISWDVVSDKIIINGYSNYIETRSEMEEAEF